MTKSARRTFSTEFKLETAQLVLDQNYTVVAAAKAKGVGKSTMDKWVRQLKQERKGMTPQASPMTPEQIEIRELKKKLARLEEHNEMFKNVWFAPFLKVNAGCLKSFASMYPAYS